MFGSSTCFFGGSTLGFGDWSRRLRGFTLFNSTWTVSDGQCSWFGDGVSLTISGEGGWFWAVSGVFSDHSVFGG